MSIDRNCSSCKVETDEEGVCMNLECWRFGRFSAAPEPGCEWPGQTVCT